MRTVSKVFRLGQHSENDLTSLNKDVNEYLTQVEGEVKITPLTGNDTILGLLVVTVKSTVVKVDGNPTFIDDYAVALAELQAEYEWEKCAPLSMYLHTIDGNMRFFWLSEMHTQHPKLLKMQLGEEHLAAKQLPNATDYIKKYIKLYLSSL